MRILCIPTPSTIAALSADLDRTAWHPNATRGGEVGDCVSDLPPPAKSPVRTVAHGKAERLSQRKVRAVHVDLHEVVKTPSS
jgi:hypothetical protein